MSLDPVEKLVSQAEPNHQRIFYALAVLVTVLAALWRGVWRYVAYKPDLDAQTKALLALTERVANLEQNDPAQSSAIAVLTSQIAQLQKQGDRILGAVLAIPAMLKGERVPSLFMSEDDDGR